MVDTLNLELNLEPTGEVRGGVGKSTTTTTTTIFTTTTEGRCMWVAAASSINVI